MSESSFTSSPYFYDDRQTVSESGVSFFAEVKRPKMMATPTVVVLEYYSYKLLFDYSELFKNTNILVTFQVKNQLKLTRILVFLRSSE